MATAEIDHSHDNEIARKNFRTAFKESVREHAKGLAASASILVASFAGDFYTVKEAMIGYQLKMKGIGQATNYLAGQLQSGNQPISNIASGMMGIKQLGTTGDSSYSIAQGLVKYIWNGGQNFVGLNAAGKTLENILQPQGLALANQGWSMEYLGVIGTVALTVVGIAAAYKLYRKVDETKSDFNGNMHMLRRQSRKG